VLPEGSSDGIASEEEYIASSPIPGMFFQRENTPERSLMSIFRILNVMMSEYRRRYVMMPETTVILNDMKTRPAGVEYLNSLKPLKFEL